jgi:hypothetical protein
MSRVEVTTLEKMAKVYPTIDAAYELSKKTEKRKARLTWQSPHPNITIAKNCESVSKNTIKPSKYFPKQSVLVDVIK